MDELGKYIATAYLISFGLSYFLGILADRYHPVRMGIASTALYAAVMVGGMFLVHDKTSFAWFFVGHVVTAGSFATLTASYGQRLFPRAIFAQFNSAMSIVLALAWVAVPPLVEYYLDRTGNQYNHMFSIALIISLLGIAAMTVVYRYFLKFGGNAGYTPPPPTPGFAATSLE